MFKIRQSIFSPDCAYLKIIMESGQE